MTITTVTEGRRGCGYRKEGGLYLRTDGIGRYCGALPIPLDVCPTCHAGIKPARGWTWVNLAALAAVRGCKLGQSEFDAAGQPGVPVNTSIYQMKDDGCGDCPIADAKIQDAGLLWIGEKFYPSPREFNSEATRMGLSRRITAIPTKFKLGETWVALAHRKAITKWIPAESGNVSDGRSEYAAGIFHVFKPQRVEYVVKADDSQEKLEGLEKRGITLVKVVKKEPFNFTADLSKEAPAGASFIKKGRNQ